MYFVNPTLTLPCTSLKHSLTYWHMLVLNYIYLENTLRLNYGYIETYSRAKQYLPWIYLRNKYYDIFWHITGLNDAFLKSLVYFWTKRCLYWHIFEPNYAYRTICLSHMIHIPWYILGLIIKYIAIYLGHTLYSLTYSSTTQYVPCHVFGPAGFTKAVVMVIPHPAGYWF